MLCCATEKLRRQHKGLFLLMSRFEAGRGALRQVFTEIWQSINLWCHHQHVVFMIPEEGDDYPGRLVSRPENDT